MRVLSYVYDSADPEPHVERVLDLLAAREDDDIEHIDLGAASDRDDARREAVMAAKGAVRIGSLPSELFDEEGRPDLSTGALVTEAETGRRTLHVGEEALAALREA